MKEIKITEDNNTLNIVETGFNQIELIGIYESRRAAILRRMLSDSKVNTTPTENHNQLKTKEFISLAIKRRLNIGVRSLNILKTMEDDYPFINNITKYDILVQRNAGKKTAMEIEDALCVIGIDMKRGNRADANTRRLEIIRRKYPTQ